MANKWRYSIFFVIGLMLLSIIISGIMRFSLDSSGFGNVVLIDLSGPIMSHSPSEGIFSSETVSSSFVIDTLISAQKDPSIIGALLIIDSPGGGAVASQEIVETLKKFDKPKVSVIHSLGASGAYWIASATDKIYSNPLSIVGSIGVTSSYLEFSGLLERYNITYERLVSGNYKDMGSPFRSLSDDEREMMMEHINYVHDFFVEDVARNRKMDKEFVNRLANGQIFIGIEAFENGLVDELGNIDEAKDYLEDLLNTTVTFRKIRKKSPIFNFMNVLGSNFAFNFGKGFASWITEERREEILYLR